MDLQECLELGVLAVERAGLILSEMFRNECRILSENERDIKLDADKEAEESILDVLVSTPYPILSEESGWSKEYEVGDRYWVVDPLDGSLNFSRKIPLCAVSIALWEEDEPLLGIVFDFIRQELFTGLVSEGTKLNGKNVRVSGKQKSSDSIVATGLPVLRPYSNEEFFEYVLQLRRFKRCRFLGSSALALAYLACGRIDAFIQDEVMLWDIAGGVALIKFAGGENIITSIEGIPWARKIRSACSSALWSK
ncbi:MAG: inositol monophosphatase [Candidatus Hydrogenedentes bacterium]|nr:inositol monophosphatase [Candidatus Hydrogenedentota bacterium]